MKTKYLIPIFLLAMVFFEAGASPRLKRICASQNGINTLFWFPYADACKDEIKIIIHTRKDNRSSWEKIDSLTDFTITNYAHKNAVSYLRGSYFIEYVYNCGKGYSIFSDTLDVDVFAPDIMQPDSISVGPNGEVLIGWAPQKALDTKSYVIYRTINGSNFPIDTVDGRGNTFLMDTVYGKPKMGAEKYKMAPMDSCDNIAPIGGLHQTIFLQLSSDSCKKEFYLNWTSYVGWLGVDHYEIWASRNDEAHYQIIGSTQNNKFTFSSAITNSKYFFFVRAIKKDDNHITSTSNRLSKDANFGIPLQYLYIYNVTVDDNNQVRVSWTNSNSADVALFKMYRSMLNDQSLSLYKTIPVVGMGQDSFTDGNTDASKTVYYYRVEAYNFCGNLIGSSNISNNILLRRDSLPDISPLNWNEYHNWQAGVENYEVQRNDALPDESSWDVINITKNTDYTDSDSFGEYSKVGICYRILGKEFANDTLGFKGRSYSNIVCRIDAPRVWIPNVFATTALIKQNSQFRPIVFHVDTLQGSMTIFNRWGERVFYSADLSHGWDGSFKGKTAPSGLYVYMIEAVGYDGTHKHYKGLVTLLE